LVDRAQAGAAALAVPEHGASLQAPLLAGLVCLLPLEPRQPTLPLFGLELTLLEAAAALIALALAWSGRRRLAALARRPPAPLVFVTIFALAHVLSALAAPAHAELAGKFALRMLVLAGYAWLVAAAPAGHRAALWALAAVACVLAAVAIAEALGVRALDPLLNRFREMPFNVAGSRRASAFTEYPNLAAAFLLYGMVAGAGLLSDRPNGWRLAIPFAALLGAALMFTYSRGALVATGVGLLAVAAVLARRPQRGRAAPALAAVGVLGLCATSFAWSGEVFRLRLGSEGTSRWYLARYEPAEKSLHLRPGELRTTPVRVTNGGRKTWTVGDEFYLAYHWWSLERQLLEEGERTPLPRDLGPGESVLLDANVRAPRQEGRLLLVWDMVHEHTTWFSGQGVTPRVVPAVISILPPADTPEPVVPGAAADVGWQPGRWELWRLALGMWRERPLLGVGADNFRWLYGPRAGRAVWDTRVFANNLYLEAAATTGTLGLVAICGTLAASGLAGARAGWSAPAVAPSVCGLVAAVAAHGAVDYLLAFTGHYLLLALVVGMAAALPRGGTP
jgi:O-antigen ligase